VRDELVEPMIERRHAFAHHLNIIRIESPGGFGSVIGVTKCDK
jgi:hypothetical protein